MLETCAGKNVTYNCQHVTRDGRSREYYTNIYDRESMEQYYNACVAKFDKWLKHKQEQAGWLYIDTHQDANPWRTVRLGTDYCYPYTHVTNSFKVNVAVFQMQKRW